MDENSIQDLFFLQSFISENASAGGLTLEISDEVETLWNEYKLTKVENDCAIISADFGRLGSLVIRYIASIEEEKELKYKSGSYDYISVKPSKPRVFCGQITKT